MKTKTNKGKTRQKPKKIWLGIGIVSLIVLLIVGYMGITYLINISQPEEPALPELPSEVLGISAISWPENDEWQILKRNGIVITDHEARSGCNDPSHGSANPSQENDIASQADCSGGGTHYNPGYVDNQFGSGQQPDATPENTFSGAIAYRDTNEDSEACNNIDDDYLFFRIRLAADPQAFHKDYLKNNVWFATFDTNNDGNAEFYVRLIGSGNKGSKDKLAVIHEEGGSPNRVDPQDHIVYTYSDPIDSNHVRRGSTPDNNIVGDTKEYFLDFQVPFELFTNSSNEQLLCNGDVVRVVNYSTSDNGNDVFKKDAMSDGPSDPITFGEEEPKGSITICKVVTDEEGNIVDGSTHSGTTFTVTGVSAPSGYTHTGIIPATDFTLPLTLDTDLIDNQLEVDGQCETYNNLSLGDYFYGEETSEENFEDWNTPLYNDQNTTALETLENFYPYSGELFTADTSDDEDRDTNADGHIVLSEARPDRTIVVLNRMSEAEAADLSVSKTDSKVTAIPGEEHVYVITVTNSGPGDVTGATVADTVSTQLTNVTWNCSASAGSTCTVTGTGNINDSVDLLAGGTATYHIYSDILPGATGTLTNTVTVEQPQGSTDPTPENNTNTDNTALTPRTDLTITKTDDPDPVVAGEQITYTIEVTNNGPSNATGVTLTDTLPAGLTYISAVPTQGTCDTSVSCSIGDMAVNDSETVVITVAVNSSVVPNSSIANTAVVTGTETDPNQQDNTVTEYTGVTGTADLEITKTDDKTTAVPGEENTYTITVTNNGPSDVVGASLNDTFSAIFESPEWTCESNPGSICSGVGSGDLNDTVKIIAGDSITYTVSGIISSGATGTLNNTATITVPETVTDPIEDNNTATDETTLVPSADVEVSKVDSPDPVTAGSMLTYTVAVTNNGPSDAVSVTVVDALPAEVNYLSATPTQGSCSQNSGEVSCNLGTIASENTVNISIKVTVKSDILEGVINNTATAASTTPDPDLSNNNGTTSTETTGITTEADLSITKTDDLDPVVAGEELTYTLTVTNAGPSDAQNVVITDQLPANTIYQDSLSSPSCDETSPGVISCLIGTLGALANDSVTIVIVPMTDGQTVGAVQIENNASVSASTTDNNSANNSIKESTTVLPSADLKILKNAKDTIIAGNDLKYTITVTNKGPSATNDITVVDTLPADVTFISATPENGSCNYDEGTITCGGFNTLNVNDKVKIIVWVHVPSSTSGDVVIDNIATVSAEEVSDPNADNNSDNAITEVNLSSNLRVTKVDAEDPVKAGTNVTYTLTVENLGPSDATGVLLVDNLPTETTFISATPDQGTCDGVSTPGTVTCSIGNLAAGASIDTEIVAYVLSNTADETVIENEADVSGNQVDGHTGNNHTQENTTIETEADIVVTKVDDPDPVTAGNNLTYLISVLNNGPSDALAVTMTDSLPNSVTYVSATPDQGSCNESSGDVTCDLGTIANADTVNVLVTVNVPSSTSQGSNINNTAAAYSEVTTDPDETNNEGETTTSTTVVETKADLSIVKTDSSTTQLEGDDAGSSNGGTVYAGEEFTYTLTVTNNGPSDATNVDVTDLLPGSLTFISATSTQGTCGENLGVVSCELGTVVAEGTVTIEIVVNPQQDGEVCNNSTVSSETSDTDNENNSNGICTIVEPSTDLSITKTDYPDPAHAWETLTYTIVVTNNGPSSAINAIVTDQLPASSNFVRASSSQGICVTNEGTMECNLGMINYPGSATITVEVIPTLETTIFNTAQVSSEIHDPNDTNNSADQDTVIQPRPGGGGGGGGGGPTPGPTPTGEEEIHLAAPEQIEKKYCLTYNPDRKLRFVDLERANLLSPDSLPEKIVPLSQKAINILKNSYIANILIQTDAHQVSDLFTFSDGLQYVVSGYKYSTIVGTPTTSGRTAYIGLDGTMSRLEMVKVFMLSHCYPVLNSPELKDGPRFYEDKDTPNQEIMHEWDDLPNIEYDDPVLNYARDVAYSAQYWWIWDGFWNEEEQRFDTVRISDPVTIAQGIKMNDRLGQLVRGETVFTRDSKLGDWYLTYYINAAEELGSALSDRILDRGRANNPLSRGEAAYELINIMIERELYSPQELQKIVDTFTNRNDEGLLSLLGLKAS